MAGRVYVVAGEMSGDAHGAGMLRALMAARPGVQIAGAGGPNMAAVAGAGLQDWVDDAAVMGVWEVLKHHRYFRDRFHAMLAELKEFRPDVLVLIDYPGFNLRFSEAVRRECPEVKQVYYVSPQVWAWHKERIPKMVRQLDEMLCLFPFEQSIFEDAGLATRFVGHPLVDELEDERLPAMARDESLLGLFPGSREREVERLFPMMVETARRLAAWREDLHFEAPAAAPRLALRMHEIVAELKAEGFVKVTDGGAHELMQRACCGVIASGTATLEAAYFGLPYCLVYKVAWPTYLLGRLLVKVKHIGLVNILAGEEVVGEFIQGRAEHELVGDALKALLEAPQRRLDLQYRLAETAAKLGGTGTHQRVAMAIARWLDGAAE